MSDEDEDEDEWEPVEGDYLEGVLIEFAKFANRRLPGWMHGDDDACHYGTKSRYCSAINVIADSDAMYVRYSLPNEEDDDELFQTASVSLSDPRCFKNVLKQVITLLRKLNETRPLGQRAYELSQEAHHIDSQAREILGGDYVDEDD